MSNQNPVFIPGPTNIPDRIRRAMNVQSHDHRAPDFADFVQPLFEDLKKVFKTQTGQVFMFSASGTGGWEAAITNTLSPGDTVLAARFGQFSHRWIDLCERLGLNVHVVDAEWGEGVPVDKYAAILAADTDREIKAVLVCHNETATGVRSDISAVRGVMDDCDHPALLYVDGISSIGAMDFRMDEWGVDLAIAGSQKGFMLPTGMVIVAASQKALEARHSAKCPRCFFDFGDMIESNAQGSFHYTPPIYLMHGLRESLDMLFEEGLENVYARHHRLAEGVRRAVSAWGLKLCARSEALYSDTVTAICVPDGFDGAALVKHAYSRYGVSYGGGLGEVAGKVFRIGHLGSNTDVLMLSGIATAEMAMKDLNFPIELGSGVAAAQDYFRKTSVGVPVVSTADAA